MELKGTMAVPQADLPYLCRKKVTDVLGNGVYEPWFLLAATVSDLYLARHHITQSLRVIQACLTLVPSTQ